MKALKITVCVLLLVVGACNRNKKDGNSNPSPDGGPVTVIADNGLAGADRDSFYHIPEGSELYPYSWMKALHTKDNQPFLNNPERFGLLPDTDPGNTNGLPIGLTVAVRRGVPFAEMVGVNCAACHVGALTYKGSLFRVDGTQNLFDLIGFYGELIEGSIATVEDPARLWEFLVRWLSEKSKETTPAATTAMAESDETETTYHLPAPPPPGDKLRALLETHKRFEDLRSAGELEGAFANEIKSLGDEIKAIHERETAASARKQAPPQTLSTNRGAVNRVSSSRAKQLAKKQPAPNGVFASTRAGGDREASLNSVLGDIGEYIRLFRSYIDFLKSLASSPAGGTAGGFGRVDAFGGARNLLFGSANARPTTAPVCYPYLWGFANFAYFHYMANTNSILQRNIGQALGLGATFEPETFGTTVDIKNTNTLEGLAWKLNPPAWPTAILGNVDSQAAARGKEIYEQKCASCHEQFNTVPNNTPPPTAFWDLKTTSLDEIGTDPNEAKNFCVPLTYEGKLTDFPGAAAILLPRIEQRYYKDFNIPAQQQVEWNHGRQPVVWRCLLAYSARPMAGVWATPPYLHNGSVLTLYDLLLPASARPKTFYLGTREYDPVRLGYMNQQDQTRSFLFDTSQPGNSNAGHEYGTDLSEEQKKDLLEYLKILELPSRP